MRMLLSFLSSRKPVFCALLFLGLIVAILEGAFVLLSKSLLTGGSAFGFPAETLARPGSLVWNGGLAPWAHGHTILWIPAAALFLLVSLRALAQIAAVQLETASVFGWIRARRYKMLRLAVEQRFPLHRAPYRPALPAALNESWE